MTGDQALALQIARIRDLGGLAKAAAPAAAVAVREVLDAQIAKGTDAEGATWQPTQEGKKPLRNASQAVTVVAVGSTVFARLKGPEARHSRGIAKGGVVRAIFPAKGLPRAYSEAVRETLAEAFRKHMGAP